MAFRDDSTDLLEIAIGYAAGSLSCVTPGSLSSPTPCAAWNLRALLEHVSDSLAALHDAIATGWVSLDVFAHAPVSPADDLVTTLMIGRDCPALLAPAMNTRMWENPIVQRNVATLRKLGYAFIEPEEGWLACRTVGAGRVAEPETILSAVTKALGKQKPRRG